MKTYPLKPISLKQAQEKQFRLVDEISKIFSGSQFLEAGDYGVVSGINKPKVCQKVEQVFANYFSAEKALLVNGAGTAAIRWGLSSIVNSGDEILVHTAPIYPTTEVTFKQLGLKVVRANFNSLSEVGKVIAKHPSIKACLIQYTRQAPEDSYDMKKLIQYIRGRSSAKIITDDNYAVMKVDKIGVELGADLSAFSCFKLLGPEGVGLLVGRKDLVESVEQCNYSGGSKIQGPVAMETLRSMVYAPVALAIQSQVNEELVQRLNKGEIQGIKKAFLANAQSKVLLVEFHQAIAKKVLAKAEKLGALPNPVGAESRYETLPLFYRVSGTFLKHNPSLADYMIRINPNRAGVETIIRILKRSIEE